ncbi:MAG: hypothetical protein LBU22_07535 [Dysgonamonadaceae bacterium]|jgi:tetratricopeptide (TPR) repeat protein|nr:hypothetical protein [Dysgonamonadaceae bacterium]
MKKTVLIIALFLGCLSANAQAPEVLLHAGNDCYTKGDYECAIQHYNRYTLHGTKDISKEIKRAEKCRKTLLLADGYFEEGDYEKAAKQYEVLIELNSSDAYAKKQHDFCKAQLTAASPLTQLATQTSTDSAIQTAPGKKREDTAKQSEPKLLVEYLFAPTAPIGVSIGYYQQWGGYLRFRTATLFASDIKETASYSQVDFDKKKYYRQAFTAGVIARIFSNTFLYGGAGYGAYGASYPINDSSSYLCPDKQKGLEVEAGARYVFNGVSVSLGYNTLLSGNEQRFGDISIGIGYSFYFKK